MISKKIFNELLEALEAYQKVGTGYSTNYHLQELAQQKGKELIDRARSEK